MKKRKSKSPLKKKCKSNQYLNKSTNRCRLKTSVKNRKKSIKRLSKSRVRHQKTNKIENKEKLSKFDYDKIIEILKEQKCKIVRILGSGAFGVVFLAIKDNSKHVAYKVQKSNLFNAYLETKSQHLLNLYNLAPPVSNNIIYYTSKKRNFSLIEMGLIDGLFIELLKEPIKNEEEIRIFSENIMSVINKLKKIGISHGDLHDENLAYVIKNGKILPILIDFGWSIIGCENYTLEILQYIRGLCFSLDDIDNKCKNKLNEIKNDNDFYNNYELLRIEQKYNIFKYNIQQLISMLIFEYNSNVTNNKLKINNDKSNIETLWNKLMNSYEKCFDKKLNSYKKEWKLTGKINEIENKINQAPKNIDNFNTSNDDSISYIPSDISVNTTFDDE